MGVSAFKKVFIVAAYVIFLRDRVVDQAEMDAYAKLAAGARGAHPITPLAYYGRAEALEGEAIDGVVILEFPNLAAARAWYDSPAYQAAKQHRLKGADYRVVLVEGVA